MKSHFPRREKEPHTRLYSVYTYPAQQMVVDNNNGRLRKTKKGAHQARY